MVINQELGQMRIECNSGALTVMTNKRRLKRVNFHHNETSDDFGDVQSEQVAKVYFESKTSQTMLTVSARKSQTIWGSSLCIPQLSVNNIIPSDSVVFRVAAGGHVEDLLSLFAAGKASLRDYDPVGQSLLHVSIVSLNFYMDDTNSYEVLCTKSTHVPVSCLQRVGCR